MQQKLSSNVNTSTLNHSNRRRSSELPGIRDVLGHELCSGGPRRRSTSREFLLGSYPKVLSIPSSPGKSHGLHGHSNPTHVPNPYSLKSDLTEHHIPKDRCMRHSSSISGISLPAILQKLRMEDDAPWEKNQSFSCGGDGMSECRRHSWNHFSDPSKFSLNAYNFSATPDGLRMSSPFKPYRLRRRDPRFGNSTRLEPYVEAEPAPFERSMPINIPVDIGSRSSDDLSSHALSRSYSSYSASYTSDNFPHTPGQEATELQPVDLRITWPETGSKQSPVQKSDVFSSGPTSDIHSVDDPRSKTPEGMHHQDDKDLHSPQNETGSKQRGKVSGTNGKFECRYCNKRFSRPSSLRTHIHSHTGEKPFRCDAPGCGRCFSVQSNLRRHQRSHSISSISPVKLQTT
ncbi:Similar to S.cerevisiae protein CMR3 (Putative zinc finger protein) [Malassezia sympodialis ATCC 42132]|uniref:Similar to S.cerevisiae protein CMR3 (Putative zinc finger protein) n=1 Tax=Malassezia sympodialis (strain ATCC 42132) TaxID=1230383 RepID=A0A1M8A1G4_MALS4|nr:Similar to S.cerevisiae protein CMR3 (Putative zinc finger protein) [Malassezia sympodialis ATCC 42132]